MVVFLMAAPYPSAFWNEKLYILKFVYIDTSQSLLFGLGLLTINGYYPTQQSNHLYFIQKLFQKPSPLLSLMSIQYFGTNTAQMRDSYTALLINMHS